MRNKEITFENLINTPATTKHEQHMKQMPILQTINQFVLEECQEDLRSNEEALSHWSPLPELKSGTHQILVNDYTVLWYLGRNVNQE